MHRCRRHFAVLCNNKHNHNHHGGRGLLVSPRIFRSPVLISRKQFCLQMHTSSSPFSPCSSPVLLSHSSKPLSLEISDPTFLLNNIANRYQSAQRILLEYVDNSLDDAEAIYRQHGDKYPKKVIIRVELDSARKRVTIYDNCNGMDYKQLSNLICNVGCSGKRGSSWLNGRFGFGVHAFRAAADLMTIYSRSVKDHKSHMVVIGRDRNEFDPPIEINWPPLREYVWPQELLSGHGTVVLLEGVQHDWYRTLTMENMAREVELHFERLLSRKNIEISIVDVSDPSDLKVRVCQPLDYDSLPGSKFERSFKVGEYECQVRLQITNAEYAGYRSRFFLRGRRVADVAQIPSFMNVSKEKHSLWGHPQLIGYIDVGECIEPVITRDDFVKSPARSGLYHELVKLEPELHAALSQEMTSQRDAAMGELETAIARIMKRYHTRVHRQEAAHRCSTSNVAKEKDENKDAQKEEEQQGNQQEQDNNKTPEEQQPPPKFPFDIQFAHLPPTHNGDMVRSQRIEKTIVVNVAHPDYVNRAKSRMGYGVFGDRLNAYVSVLLAGHYREYMVEKAAGASSSATAASPALSLNDIMDTMVQLEEGFKKEIPKLQKPTRYGTANVDVE